jgi:hypothetical protein
MDEPGPESAPHPHRLAETVAEYHAPGGARGSGTPHRKLSISLPAELADEVQEAATLAGVSVSSVIAAALRSTLDRVDQARIDRALALDAEDNAAWSKATLELTGRAWADLEW